MRIISGSLKGKKLLTPKKEDDHIRPTADRARETLFNILNSKQDTPLSSQNVLDIFSGTGAFGLEAASRGAKAVTFVDLDLTLTKKNTALCGFKNVHFIKKDARRLPPALAPYDLIFLDAPYNKSLTEPTLATLCANNYLASQTLIIAETAKDEPLTIPPTLELIDERTSGAARFSFLILKNE